MNNLNYRINSDVTKILYLDTRYCSIYIFDQQYNRYRVSVSKTSKEHKSSSVQGVFKGLVAYIDINLNLKSQSIVVRYK
jgi:hypothetical protein